MHFHIPLLLVLPVSRALSSSALPVSLSMSVSSLLSLTICFSLPVSPGLFSLAHFLPPRTKIILYPSTPSGFCNSSGRAIRPISPISWCWVGMMRNGLAVMRVACTAVWYVCVCGQRWMWWVCGLMDGCEVCVWYRGTENKKQDNRKRMIMGV